MRTILERNETTLIRDRSSFIGIILHVTSIALVEQYLKEIKKQYPKAKHYCYAYKIDNQKKCSDDGEPSKTAGRPLLELLERKDLNEALLVVVRYFGGVLLGASRLMSTYLECGVQTLLGADFSTILTKYVYHLELSYSDFEHLKYLSKRDTFSLENIVYETKIGVDVNIDEEYVHVLVDEFPHSSIELFGKKKVYQKEY